MKVNGLDSRESELASATNVRLAALEARTRRIEERAEEAREQHHADNLRVISAISDLDLKVTSALGDNRVKLAELKGRVIAYIAGAFACGGAAGTGVSEAVRAMFGG